MRVYVLVHDNWEDDEVVGVYSTRDNALKKMEANRDYFIHVVDVDGECIDDEFIRV